MSILTVLALASCFTWIYLLFGRGMFWLARERDDRCESPQPELWPAVVAVVPARNEADVIARSITSLLSQDYPGPFRVVLVDDQSDDATATVATKAAEALGAMKHLDVVVGQALPQGWVGKMWALSQGAASAIDPVPKYFLFTDADIGHRADNLRRLVARAESGGLVLTSLMAKLACESFAERLLIPAFVFFFDMLFPFAWVNQASRHTAAAAGGCMLVNRIALVDAGGVTSIRSAMIDDCALAVRLKRHGPIWLGFTDRAQSLRAYGSIAEIAAMVSRSAYAQLKYSPLLLAGTVFSMVLVYLIGPAAALLSSGWPCVLGLFAWAAMAVSFQPILRLYRSSPLWGLALPLIGALYTAFTLQSAFQTWRGRGGVWKGRVQAIVAAAPEGLV